MRVLRESGDAQRGGDGAPSRGQDGAEDQHQHVLPGWCGEALLERLHPRSQSCWHKPAQTCTRHLFPKSAPGEKLTGAEPAANPLIDHIEFNLGELA